MWPCWCNSFMVSHHFVMFGDHYSSLFLSVDLTIPVTEWICTLLVRAHASMSIKYCCHMHNGNGVIMFWFCHMVHKTEWFKCHVKLLISASQGKSPPSRFGDYWYCSSGGTIVSVLHVILEHPSGWKVIWLNSIISLPNLVIVGIMGVEIKRF